MSYPRNDHTRTLGLPLGKRGMESISGYFAPILFLTYHCRSGYGAMQPLTGTSFLITSLGLFIFLLRVGNYG